MLALAAAALAAACRSGDVEKGQALPPGAPTATAAQPVKARDRKPPFASPPWHIPVGPKLGVVPGKGLGPIQFGARVDTIERLIGEPCEEKREEAGKLWCRYSAQALEFVLVDGAVVQMRVHRLDRPFRVEPKLGYGIFNGGFENGVALGMLPEAVTEALGAPKAVRTLDGENPNHTVEVRDYDGFSLEFDRVNPAKVSLGGIILDAPKKG